MENNWKLLGYIHAESLCVSVDDGTTNNTCIILEMTIEIGFLGGIFVF
jgi:hypothetical protein